jgi:hypothetical protein
MYRPDRMLSTFRIYIQGEQFEKVPVGKFLQPFLPRLRLITPEELTLYLGTLLKCYQKDTLIAMNEVQLHQDAFTYPLEHGSGVKAVRFQVVPQGPDLQRGETERGRFALDRQEVVPGLNLEQLTGVEEAKTRSGPSAARSYPTILSDKKFVADTLMAFSTNLMRRLVQNKEFIGKAFPIFNRVHPANVIPVEAEDGVWDLKVTDLSTSICVDYAPVLYQLAVACDQLKPAPSK